MATLVPAYGRDYKSAKAVKQDFFDGKDFKLMDLSSPYAGKYCSIRDFPKGTTLQLRYKKHTAVTIVVVK